MVLPELTSFSTPLPVARIIPLLMPVSVPPLPMVARPVMTRAGGSPSTLSIPLSMRPPVLSRPPTTSRVAPGLTALFQFARAVGHAPVPFQIKTVDGGGVGSFDVVMLVFGSSPPSRELGKGNWECHPHHHCQFSRRMIELAAVVLI